MSARLPDWAERLSAYLADAAKRPHVYGSHDCLLHCAAVVEAETGEDFGTEHRGRYSTKAGAAKYLKSIGFSSPADLIDAHLPEKPVAKAMRGDLVLDDEGIPGVCIGGEALMAGTAQGQDGFVRVPRCNWTRAWAVGA